MGMGDGIGTYETIKYLLSNYKGILIIDADGLNALAKFGIEILRNKGCRVVLTPHVGEFSRLCGVDKGNILCNTIEIAKEFARHNGVILLLKNATSVVTDGEAVFVNTAGCAGMAKAGSGDVLSGIITGITARQNENLCEAVAVSAHLFGLVGECVKKEQNDFTMTASDLICCLPKVINKIV
jgi:NAD(P)H-hydrate epimerase